MGSVRLRPALRIASLLGPWLGTGTVAAATHSDIIVSHTDGVLRVDSPIHTGDVRENDASGNGTAWASDNPGFAGSRFVFGDELLFDVTGPLLRWAGGRWSTRNLGPEIMQFIEPGPFGDPLNSVTSSGTTSLVPGYPNQTAESKDVAVHFQVNGIATRLSLKTQGEDLRLSLGTQVGLTYQLQMASTVAGPWNNDGAPFVGTGLAQELSLRRAGDRQLFRIEATHSN